MRNIYFFFFQLIYIYGWQVRNKSILNINKNEKLVVFFNKIISYYKMSIVLIFQYLNVKYKKVLVIFM